MSEEVEGGWREMGRSNAALPFPCMHRGPAVEEGGGGWVAAVFLVRRSRRCAFRPRSLLRAAAARSRRRRSTVNPAAWEAIPCQRLSAEARREKRDKARGRDGQRSSPTEGKQEPPGSGAPWRHRGERDNHQRLALSFPAWRQEADAAAAARLGRPSMPQDRTSPPPSALDCSAPQVSGRGWSGGGGGVARRGRTKLGLGVRPEQEGKAVAPRQGPQSAREAARGSQQWPACRGASEVADSAPGSSGCQGRQTHEEGGG